MVKFERRVVREVMHPQAGRKYVYSLACWLVNKSAAVLFEKKFPSGIFFMLLKKKNVVYELSPISEEKKNNLQQSCPEWNEKYTLIESVRRQNI